ncbi:MAG: ATP-binding protein [Myxococcota bacterium]|nr:ATP-binding protein [Myxococcota bacterium]
MPSDHHTRSALWFYLTVCGVALSVGLYGFYLLLHRPALPRQLDRQTLIGIDGIDIQENTDIEFALSRRVVGDRVTLQLRAGGGDSFTLAKVKLVPHYSQVPFPVIFLLTGLFTLLLGVVAILLRTGDPKARVFFAATVAFSYSVMVDSGFYCLNHSAFSFIPGLLYYGLYPLSPTLLFHFSLCFGDRKALWPKIIAYALAFLFIVVFEFSFVATVAADSVAYHRLFQRVLYYFRIHIVVACLLTAIHFVAIYVKSTDKQARAQIKVIFVGLCLGLAPFILAFQMPQVLGFSPLISEDISMIFMGFIPITFLLSFIKFDLMGIKVAFTNSLVYAVLTIATVGIYLFSVTVIQNTLAKHFDIHAVTASLIGALLVAALFHPLRIKIQDIVDRTFYRKRQDFKQLALGFGERTKHISSISELVGYFLSQLEDALALERVGVGIYHLKDEKPVTLAEQARNVNSSRVDFVRCIDDALAPGLYVGQTGRFLQIDAFLAEHCFEAIFRIPFGTAGLFGILGLGPKKSHRPLNNEEVVFLTNISVTLAISLERINLLQEVIFERAEKEKLTELNQMKTEFISTLSHELRTPMSAIQSITELLSGRAIDDENKRMELIELIAEESARLSRLLHNILDYGNIERSGEHYCFQEEEAKSIIGDVLKLFSERLRDGGFSVRECLSAGPVIVHVDRDAFKQVLVNLIDNAIKYSTVRKEIDISLTENKNHVEISVRDRGQGIAEDEQDKIFEGFYRSKKANGSHRGGVGLGLKIAFHIMAAHNGSISVSGRAHGGTCFELRFPRR